MRTQGREKEVQQEQEFEFVRNLSWKCQICAAPVTVVKTRTVKATPYTKMIYCSCDTVPFLNL